MAIYSGFTHEKWWFSIVTLVYQRVTMVISGWFSMLYPIYKWITMVGGWSTQGSSESSVFFVGCFPSWDGVNSQLQWLVNENRLWLWVWQITYPANKSSTTANECSSPTKMLRVGVWYHGIPSGKRLHNKEKSPFCKWVNPLFLWSMAIYTIAMLLYHGVSHHGINKPTIFLWPFSIAFPMWLEEKTMVCTLARWRKPPRRSRWLCRNCFAKWTLERVGTVVAVHSYI